MLNSDEAAEVAQATNDQLADYLNLIVATETPGPVMRALTPIYLSEAARRLKAGPSIGSITTIGTMTVDGDLHL